MEWAFVKALLWGLLLFLQFHGHTAACLQEERIALLELKAFLESNIIYADNHRLLLSWIDDAKSDCCDWERVTCNSTTAHVIKLSLYNLNQDPDYYEDPYSYAYEYEDKKHWLLNVSLLVPLKELTTLNLSGNAIGGCLPNEGFESLSRLENLETLDLSYNNFNRSIIELLSAAKSLKNLNLASNGIKGLFSAKGFESLPRLENLETLDLSNNNFNRSIIELLSAAKSLKNLNLAWNGIEGLFLPKGFESLSILENLETLDLSYNYFNRTIFESLTAVKSLKNLNLGYNRITGSFPAQEVSALENLEKLDLSFNQLNGFLTFQGLSNFSRLEILDLTGNYFGSISPHIGALSSLKAISLAWNEFNGTLPKGTLPAIPLQWNLRYLDISNNNMSGTIPGWMVNRRGFQTFDVSNNSFEGQIPCRLVDSLQLVDLSHNSLSGSLPSCLNPHSVFHLLLQGNKLTGPIPKAIFNSSFLVTLDLRDNSFSGSIPVEIGTLSNLIILLLKGNNFSGIIPNQLCCLNMIGIMDLSNNSLSGTIPHCFQNMSFGKLVDNEPIYDYPYGGRYVQVGSTFQKLLDGNSEEDWEILYRKEIEVVFVTKYRFNSYHGNILNYMSGLDLSCNKLTGRIPPKLGELSSIHALNLSYNQLTGSIPQTFSNLINLESLDLSHNNLSGEIPSVLIDLNFLAVFTVAYNNLSGKVPNRKAQFATFDKSSYEGNPFLCGQPLENSCTGVDESHPSPTKSSNASEGKWYEIDHQVFFASFTASYIVFFLGVATLLYIHPYWQQRCFNFIEDFK